MFIPVEQRPETPFIHTLPVAAVIPVARVAESSVTLPGITEELLIEEVSIDGMCGVY